MLDLDKKIYPKDVWRLIKGMLPKLKLPKLTKSEFYRRYDFTSKSRPSNIPPPRPQKPPHRPKPPPRTNGVKRKMTPQELRDFKLDMEEFHRDMEEMKTEMKNMFKGEKW